MQGSSSTSTRPVARALFVLLLAAGAAAISSCRAIPSPPDLVLVTLDCLRADRLEAYGGAPQITPNLNRLAERGTVFERAYTAIGTTFPSHTTMLTGLYPRSHGVRRNGHRLPDETTTAAEILTALGYRTASFVAYGQMHYLGNLKQGFETVSDGERPGGRQGKRDGRLTTAMAIDWLRDLPGETGGEERAPFFLWVHLFDAHGPYRLNDYSRERLAGYQGLLADGASMPELQNRKAAILETPESRQALATLYDGEVHKMDAHVGELVAAVRSIDRAESTVWVVAADHGQALGDEGRMGHGPVLWEPVLRVPLLIADTRRETARRVETTVGLVDVMPTLLDLAGFDERPLTQGRSLVPALTDGSLPPNTYFAEVKVGDPRRGERVAVYDGGFKLEYYTARRNRLYELVGEPPGLRPVSAAEHPQVQRRMISLAQRYLEQESVAHETELLPEDIETLRALGYVE